MHDKSIQHKKSIFYFVEDVSSDVMPGFAAFAPEVGSSDLCGDPECGFANTPTDAIRELKKRLKARFSSNSDLMPKFKALQVLAYQCNLVGYSVARRKLNSRPELSRGLSSSQA